MKKLFLSFGLLLLCANGLGADPLNKMTVKRVSVMGMLFRTNTDFEYHKTKELKTNSLSISAYSKDIDYHQPGYQPGFDFKVFFEIEDAYPGQDIPMQFFNTHRRWKEINGQIWVDSLVLSVYELEDRQFMRRLITTTDNLFIIIEIKLTDLDLRNAIFSEAPDFFAKREWGAIWKDADAFIDFGDKLLSGEVESATANAWYASTEKVINSITLR